jgi:hypothetical protein
MPRRGLMAAASDLVHVNAAVPAPPGLLAVLLLLLAGLLLVVVVVLLLERAAGPRGLHGAACRRRAGVKQA